MIYNESARKKELKIPLAEIRYVQDKYASPLSIAIYGDNINILIFNQDNPLAIHIKSREIAQSFMNYFNLMWAVGKE